MKKIPADYWAGLAMVAVVVGAAYPVLFRVIDPSIHYFIWVGVFVGMLAAVLLSLLSDGQRWGTVSFCASVVASWALLLTTNGSTGFLAIICVVLAAVSVYIVHRLLVGCIILANTVVLAIASYLSSTNIMEIVLVTGLYLLLQIGTALTSIAIIREQDIRKRLSEKNIELQAAGVLLEESTRTAERLRISRDLHDSIGHKLTVLSLELEAARHSEDEDARKHIEKASGVAREVLGDLRTTVSAMREDAGDLTAALHGVVDGIPSLDISVHVDDTVGAQEEVQEVLVRAVQEIATNAMRHADARELRISLREDEDGTVLFEARDDGRGSVNPTPGNGLLGMIERFDAIGGEVTLDGSNGFGIVARIPGVTQQVSAT